MNQESISAANLACASKMICTSRKMVLSCSRRRVHRWSTRLGEPFFDYSERRGTPICTNAAWHNSDSSSLRFSGRSNTLTRLLSGASMHNVLLASAVILFININAQPQGAPQKPQTQPAETRPAGETPQGAQTTPRPGAPQTMDGYGAQNTQAERDSESRFRSIPSTDNLRDYMQRLSLHPHAVGQPFDKDNAEWILAKFKEWGW